MKVAVQSPKRLNRCETLWLVSAKGPGLISLDSQAFQRFQYKISNAWESIRMKEYFKMYIDPPFSAKLYGSELESD